MSTLTEEQARAYMHKLLAAMRQAGGSDLFIANDFPPSMKANGSMQAADPAKADRRCDPDAGACADERQAARPSLPRRWSATLPSRFPISRAFG